MKTFKNRSNRLATCTGSGVYIYSIKQGIYKSDGKKIIYFIKGRERSGKERKRSK